MKVIQQNLLVLIETIEMCIEKKKILPCLVLIYTGIDILASLERSSKVSIKNSFTKWAKNYMLKAKPLSCSAIELYSARCGILHTFTANSDLSNINNNCRRIIYAWGNSNSAKLQKVNEKLNISTDVALHISDLFESFQLGIDLYFREVMNDSIRVKLILDSSKEWFSNLSEESLNAFLNLNKE